MTPEQRLDRLERMARLLYEATVRDSRESRKRRAQLEGYWTALSEHDAAKLAAAERPEDLETSETLRRATEGLDRAREELKQAIETGRTRQPKATPN
ncbi:MAG TPA: hypothetical protein VEW46_05555 [Pyrinomonadaceae bacterium]|nr:hypothetical protein [Pyrinomonadaceae bacterium]